MSSKYVSLLIIFSIPQFFDFGASGSEQLKTAFKVVENWSKYNGFGQISGVGVDSFDNVYVFHRGDRRWDITTFTNDNIFTGRDEGPITEDTIVILDSVLGTLLAKTGNGLFYLPHGLTIDHENNVWITDVALHQVFKFPPFQRFIENEEIYLKNPLLKLGVAFEPGTDDKHFCKPTDVAVDAVTNDFFVSDGYCNSRIVKYNKYGEKILVWGRSSLGDATNDFYMLSIPHALSISQKTSELFVADRENFRVLVYDAVSGKFKKVFSEGFSSRIYSVVYSESGLVFALVNNDSLTGAISVYDANTKERMPNAFPKGYLTNPHDLAVSSNGKFCYVVELNPFKIWKFELGLSHESKENNLAQPETTTTASLHTSVNAEAQFDKKSTYLAVGLVALVIATTFIFFMFHLSRRKAGFRKYELRRLIFDEDDDEDDVVYDIHGGGRGGIRLT